MSRSRMIGAVSALAASVALVAGCGGADDGFTAAQAAPTTPATTAPAAAAPAPGSETSTKALGAFPSADPTKPTYRSYDTFSSLRAGTIFVSPIKPKAEVPAATPAPTESAPPTEIPGGTSGTGTGGGTSSSTVPLPSPVTTGYMANIEVNGKGQTISVGAAVAGQFTVQSITADTVTLKLNSGTLPGGGDTIDIKAGESNELSHPTAGTFTIAVKSITPES